MSGEAWGKPKQNKLKYQQFLTDKTGNFLANGQIKRSGTNIFEMEHYQSITLIHSKNSWCVCVFFFLIFYYKLK